MTEIFDPVVKKVIDLIAQQVQSSNDIDGGNKVSVCPTSGKLLHGLKTYKVRQFSSSVALASQNTYSEKPKSGHRANCTRSGSSTQFPRGISPLQAAPSANW